MKVDFDGAIEDYNRALELDPDLFVARYNRGTVNYRMGRFKAAEGDLTEACRAQPDNREFAEGLRACQDEIRKQ